MKINMAEIKEKAVGLYKKIGKKTIIIASSVLVIGIAVMLNFILWGAAKDTKKSPAVDLSNLSAVKSGENSTESTVTYEYVKDGKFSLANGNLSFKMPKDWKLASASIAYQFASTDEYNENKFNLVVSKTNSPIEDVTSEQMTATYKATMEDFKLVDFQHTEIAGKKAIYMQLTGMVSQVTKQTTITQYMIQSGEDAYCFSFTQSTEDETFPDLIAGVIDSLEIK